MPFHASDVRRPSEYESDRVDSRRRLADHQRARRVHLGDLVTLVFIDSATLAGVAEEMLRSNRVNGDAEVEAEIAAVGTLAPLCGEQLCALLVLEVADPADLNRRQAELADLARSVRLEIGADVVTPVDDIQGESNGAGIGYLRFQLDVSQRHRLTSGDGSVSLGVDHPAYQARALLSREQREALAVSLASG